MKFYVGDKVKIECDENPDHWAVGCVGVIMTFPEPEVVCGILPHKMYTVKIEVPNSGTHMVYILAHDLRAI